MPQRNQRIHAHRPPIKNKIPGTASAIPGIQNSAPVSLESRTRRAQKFPQRRNIRPIRAHAPCIHRQPQHLRLLDAYAGIVQLRQAISFRRRQPPPRPVQRAKRAMVVPALPYNVEEIIPIPAIPHDVLPCAPGPQIPLEIVMDAALLLSVASNFQLGPGPAPAYSGPLRVDP
jgi:hypothetical protein